MCTSPQDNSTEDQSSQPQHVVATTSYLQALYERDQRPWVVAYSGGKDSTLVLHLVYELIQARGVRAHKPVFVLSTDTRVEAPTVAAHVRETLERIRTSAAEAKLPISVRLVEPTPEESFWGKLIGKGYPSPTKWFRWCTTNMKIRPARRVVNELTQEHGSAILLLGSRTSESSARKRRLQRRETNDAGLNPHHEIPNALVATPIVHWTNEQVWNYLLANPASPWGGSHAYLFDLYKLAGGDECPVVLDLDTPSCGGSRFGCWTCTVVARDRSLEGFIEAGEDNLLPLNQLRNWLKEIRESSEYRSLRRRDGVARPNIRGPFRPAKRIEILERLLVAERDVGHRLISDSEIRYIQEVWSAEFDLSDSAFALAERFGRSLPREDTGMRQLPAVEREVLDEMIAEYGLPPDLMEKLLDMAFVKYGIDRGYGSGSRFQTDIAALIDTAVTRDSTPEEEK